MSNDYIVSNDYLPQSESSKEAFDGWFSPRAVTWQTFLPKTSKNKNRNMLLYKNSDKKSYPDEKIVISLPLTSPIRSVRSVFKYRSYFIILSISCANVPFSWIFCCSGSVKRVSNEGRYPYLGFHKDKEFQNSNPTTLSKIRKPS